MQNDALESLPKIRNELETAVLDILSDRPDGVRTRKLQFKLYDHPEFNKNPMPHLYIWMAELKRDGVIVIDHPGKRYLHPEHADLEPEKYKPGGRPLDV